MFRDAGGLRARTIVYACAWCALRPLCDCAWATWWLESWLRQRAWELTSHELAWPMGYVPDPNEHLYLLPEFDEENNRFVIQLYDGDCELLFDIKETEPYKTITFKDVKIPETARGQDIGAKLAKAAFDYAVKNKMDVVIKSAFLANYYTANRRKYRRKLRVTGRYPQPQEEIDKHF
ncbi:GCN5-related n-acetyl-transferase domain-containing protein [Phthorimaea operculella]|nr:GCN5-related n-acetyl-transferase domain-containing protein [Phthorimaea operculella]